MSISPLSEHYNWEVEWISASPHFNIEIMFNINVKSVKKKKALGSLASVGVIGKEQLSQIFRLNRKEIEEMITNNLFIEHKLIRNNEGTMPIITLGYAGALAIKLDNYEENYWFQINETEILRCILFFQLYLHFPHLEVLATPHPFTGSIVNNGSVIYVYVLKDNISDFARYLRWDKKGHHRVVVIIENPEELAQLEMFLNEIELRVVLEEDLFKKDMSNNIFYRYKDGKMIK